MWSENRDQGFLSIFLIMSKNGVYIRWKQRTSIIHQELRIIFYQGHLGQNVSLAQIELYNCTCLLYNQRKFQFAINIKDFGGIILQFWLSS